MANPFKRLLDELTGKPLLRGQVVRVHSDGRLDVRYRGGGVERITGEAELNDWVLVQDGKLSGPSSDLTQISVEI